MSGEKHEDLSAFISTGERAQREKEKEDQQQCVKGQLRVLASTQRSPCTMSNGAAFHVAGMLMCDTVKNHGNSSSRKGYMVHLGRNRKRGQTDLHRQSPVVVLA